MCSNEFCTILIDLDAEFKNTAAKHTVIYFFYMKNFINIKFGGLERIYFDFTLSY